MQTLIPDHCVLQRHKALCQDVQRRSKLLRELDLLRTTQPGDVPLHVLDKRLEKWRHVTIAALFYATIQALELPRGLSRAATHVLFVSLSPRKDHDNRPGKYFEVAEARVIAFKDGHKQVTPSPAFMARAEQMRAETEHTFEEAVAYAIVAAPPIPGMTCEPVPVQEDVRDMEIDVNWKENFMNAVREGEGGTKLGKGVYLLKD